MNVSWLSSLATAGQYICTTILILLCALAVLHLYWMHGQSSRRPNKPLAKRSGIASTEKEKQEAAKRAGEEDKSDSGMLTE